MADAAGEVKLAAVGRGVPSIERAWGWHLWRPRWLPGRLLAPLKRWALRRYATPIECRLDTGQRFMARPDDLVQCEIAITGSWEGLIYRAVRPLVEPGAVVVDVGAHVGYSTLLFADWVGAGGHVYCFEPVIAHAEQLRENVRLNGYEDRVVINRVAVAAREGTADFYHDTTLNSGMGSLAPRPGQRRRLHVPTVGLDRWLDARGIERVGLVKMDIEGAEGLALQGMADGLACHRYDVLLVEVHRGELGRFGYSVTGVLSKLREAGYRLMSWEDLGWFASGPIPDSVDYLLALAPAVTGVGSELRGS